jgi:hypothetical protein
LSAPARVIAQAIFAAQLAGTGLRSDQSATIMDRMALQD